MNKNILKIIVISVSLALSTGNALANKEDKEVNKFSKPFPKERVVLNWREKAEAREHFLKFGNSGEILCISIRTLGRERFCVEKY